MSHLKDSLGALNNEYDICILGSENIGKSSLVLHYIYNKFIDEIDSSVEDLYTKVIRNGTFYNEVTILDTNSRQDNYNTSRKKQLNNTSGIIFAYSIAQEESLYVVEDLFDRILELRGEMPPIVLVGLQNDLEEDRKVSFEQGQDLADRLHALSFIECSAKYDSMVEEVFQPLIKAIFESRNSRSRRDLLLRNPDATSLQSLREVLSSSSPTPERTTSPIYLMNKHQPSSQHTSNSVIGSSLNEEIPKSNYDAETESIEIPKFKSNTFKNGETEVEEKETTLHSKPSRPQSKPKSNTQGSNRKYVKDDYEDIQNKVRNHKPKSSCCTIV